MHDAERRQLVVDLPQRILEPRGEREIGAHDVARTEGQQRRIAGEGVAAEEPRVAGTPGEPTTPRPIVAGDETRALRIERRHEVGDPRLHERERAIDRGLTGAEREAGPGRRRLGRSGRHAVFDAR
jgi:hypothetical protein